MALIAKSARFFVHCMDMFGLRTSPASSIVNPAAMNMTSAPWKRRLMELRINNESCMVFLCVFKDHSQVLSSVG